MSLVFGTAPDSWGVWYPQHESQPSGDRFLDEVAAAGYKWVELGPYGFLPTDPAELRSALDQRGLDLIAGTLITDIGWEQDRAIAEAERVARLAAPLGAKFVVLLTGGYRAAGKVVRPRELDAREWAAFIATTNALGRRLREDFGLTLTFHPHADSVVEYDRQVEQFLADTDAQHVQLCLDTGHYEYRDGDSVALMRRHWQRIPFLHLKSIDARLKERIQIEDIDFASAVQLGAICEPAQGAVDFPGLQQVMIELGYQGWAVVEQDMHPLPSLNTPLPIAIRTREYFKSVGWTVARSE